MHRMKVVSDLSEGVEADRSKSAYTSFRVTLGDSDRVTSALLFLSFILMDETCWHRMNDSRKFSFASVVLGFSHDVVVTRTSESNFDKYYWILSEYGILQMSYLHYHIPYSKDG